MLSKPAIKRFIFIFPLIFIIFFILIRIIFFDVYKIIIYEDNIIEYSQGLVYLLSSLLAFFIAYNFLKKKKYILFSVYFIFSFFFFFIAGEEISWGQRILNLEISDFFATRNAQHELTIHNLGTIQYYLHRIYFTVGFFGAFLWFFLLLLIPKKIIRTHRAVMDFFIPGRLLMLYFLPVAIVYSSFLFRGTVLSIEQYIVSFDQEPAELLLAIGFFLFLIINTYRQKQFLSKG